MSPSEAYAFAHRLIDEINERKDRSADWTRTIDLTTPRADALIKILLYYIRGHHSKLQNKDVTKCPATQTNRLPNQMELPFQSAEHPQ